ncbi:MAG: hypothetical protein IPQ18_14210 [Saprospiraceae bacterium]|nr:hypothetical protein [Saprospiraceae bacterium]
MRIKVLSPLTELWTIELLVILRIFDFLGSMGKPGLLVQAAEAQRTNKIIVSYAQITVILCIMFKYFRTTSNRFLGIWMGNIEKYVFDVTFLHYFTRFHNNDPIANIIYYGRIVRK